MRRQGCGLKGHNRSNHPSELKGMLKRAFGGLNVYEQVAEANDTLELINEAEDSWF